MELATQKFEASVDTILQMAEQCQQSGDVTQATYLYQEVLKVQPDHALANHQLGFIETHTIGIAHALPRFEHAVMQQPENEQFWVSYIDALMMMEAFEAVPDAIQFGLQYGLSKDMANLLLEECQANSASIPLIAEEATVQEQPLKSTPAEPVKWIRKSTSSHEVFPEHWLQAYPQALMIEYTSRCNLRCKYCSKSNPGDDKIPGRNMDMTAHTIEAVIQLIRDSQYQELLLAGTGESTFHPDWKQDFPRLVQAGKQANKQCYVHVNTNFAMKYEDEDWAVFAMLDGIVISIDTADRQLTREVRAKSDLGLIIYNIVRFQTYCKMHGLPLPKLTINVTLYQEATAGLPDLMMMLADLPISLVTISDIYEREATDIHGIRPLNNRDPQAFIQAVQYIEQAAKLAQQSNKFTLYIQPHLVNRIQTMLSELQSNSAPSHASTTIQLVKPGHTKRCLQPWTRFTLAADAAIFPCCVTEMEPVGDIGSGKDEDGLNGKRIRQFRSDLLSGQVPQVCQGCTNAPDCSIEELQEAIDQLAKR